MTKRTHTLMIGTVIAIAVILLVMEYLQLNKEAARTGIKLRLDKFCTNYECGNAKQFAEFSGMPQPQ